MAFDPDKYLGQETGSTTSAKTKEPLIGFDPDAFLSASEARDAITKEQVSTFDFIANQAKLGLTDTATLGQAIIDTFVTDPFKKLYSTVTGKPDTAPGGIAQRFGTNIKRLQEAAGTVTGAQPSMAPSSELAAIAGSGVRALSDPVGYIGAPLKATGVLGRALGLGTVGGTAEVGGMIGEGTEKTLFGTSGETGRAIGSITAAVKGAPIAAGVQETAVGALNIKKQIQDKYKAFKADPDDASKTYASGAAKRLLEIIAKEQPGEKLENVITEFNRISNTINKDNLPLMVAIADNPVVRQQVIRLAKTNPEFRQRLNIELDTLAKNIDDRADLIFGKRYAPVSGVETVNVNNAIKRRQQIDTQIEKLSGRLDTGVDEAAVGKAVTNLVDARLKEVTKEMSPVYEGILNDAKKAGAKLPDTAVRSVYNFVVGNNIRDIFGKGTAVDKKILNVWGPQNGEFFPASFQEVDSLKKEINRLQRGSLTRDEARKLDQLEDVLNNARQQIPGSFNQRLIDADLAYYEKVGVPFNAQGIKDIDAKKYAEQVAPVIIKNSSALKQFIGAVGQESATPVVRNSILSEAYEKSVKEGVINPVALRRYMNQKEAVLNQVPTVKRELEEALIDQGKLALERSRINDAVTRAESRISNNFVASVAESYGLRTPNYREITNRMFNDSNFATKIQKDLKDLDAPTAKAVRNSLRAEIIDIARSNADGGIAFITNPKNARVVNEAFGPGYTPAVKDLLKMSDALKRADIDRLTAGVQKGELDALASTLDRLGIPGLDAPFVFSTARDRIASIPQKAVRLLTRVNTAKIQDETDKAITNLLLDKNGIQELQKVSKEINFNVQNPVSFQKYVDRLKNLLPQYFYVGVKQSTFPEEQAIPRETVFGGFEEETEPFQVDIQGVGQPE
jgi:hypothetical protein